MRLSCLKNLGFPGNLSKMKMEGNAVYPGASTCEVAPKPPETATFSDTLHFVIWIGRFKRTSGHLLGGDTAYFVESQVRKQWNEYMTHAVFETPSLKHLYNGQI